MQMPKLFKAAVLVFVWFAHAVSSMSIDEARTLIRYGDPAELEAAFANLDASVRAGDLSHDDHRDVYGTFLTTDTDVHDRVSAWRSAYPDSLYAQTAGYWIDYWIAWMTRGEKSSRETYPDALATFERVIEDVQQGGIAMIEADPAFIPGSDLLFRAAKLVRPPRNYETLVASVMQAAPNFGTLHRALGITAPHWGGHWRALTTYCQRYAGLVTDREDYTSQVCMLDGAITYRHSETRIRMLANLIGDFDRDVLRDHMAYDSIVLRPHRRGAPERAQALVEDPGFQNKYLISRYDREVAYPNGFPSIGDQKELEAYEQAKVAIAYDPYNADYIFRIAYPPYLLVNNGGSPVSKEEEHTFLLRALAFSPYNATAWRLLSSIQSREDRLNDPLSFVPAASNAVVYSNHDAVSLRAMMDKYRSIHWSRLRYVNEPERYPEQHAAYPDSVLASLTSEDYVCPWIRAYRNWLARCGRSDGMYPCDSFEEQEALLGGLTKEARRGHSCQRELRAEVRELVYEPVEVKLTR